eukprot:158141_1
MSCEVVTTFVVTIFHVSSKPDKPIDDTIYIGISHNSEKYKFNLNEIIFPQSCSFYSNTISRENKNTINITIGNKSQQKHKVQIDIPLELYFNNSIINEFVMSNINGIDNNIDNIPPIITLSITPIIPLPVTIINTDNNNDKYLMYNYLNNNMPSPIYGVNLLSNTLEYKIYNSINDFIDNAELIVSNLKDKNKDKSNDKVNIKSITIWNEIKKYIKDKKQRHM